MDATIHVSVFSSIDYEGCLALNLRDDRYQSTLELVLSNSLRVSSASLKCGRKIWHDQYGTCRQPYSSCTHSMILLNSPYSSINQSVRLKNKKHHILLPPLPSRRLPPSLWTAAIHVSSCRRL